MAKTSTRTTSEQPEIIYSMMRVSKIYNNKPVIKDISLSYFYGAKIGVLGLNGSGKSSLLRILAGVDTEYNGKAVLSPGTRSATSLRSRSLTSSGPSARLWRRGCRRPLTW